MTEKTISLKFGGYWRDKNSGGIPNDPGIYLVYACTFDRQADTVSLRELMYVGEAAKVCGRIQGHERRPDWKKRLRSGEQLCFAFAPITNPDRERGEAALIHYHKPPVNTEYTDSFPFDDTTVISAGRCRKITSPITVLRSVKVRVR